MFAAGVNVPTQVMPPSADENPEAEPFVTVRSDAVKPVKTHGQPSQQQSIVVVDVPRETSSALDTGEQYLVKAGTK